MPISSWIQPHKIDAPAIQDKSSKELDETALRGGDISLTDPKAEYVKAIMAITNNTLSKPYQPSHN